MKNLILTSGGYYDGQRGKELDKLIEEICEDKKVLIIENASAITSDTNYKVTIVKNLLEIADTVGMYSLTEKNIDKIFEYDVLYIIGGDNAPLIEMAKIPGINENIKSFLIQEEKHIICESAGSIIFGKDLKWRYDVMKGTKPKYDVILPSYKGLGLLDINIFPHWNKRSEEEKKRAEDYAKKNKIKLTYLNDGEWLEFCVFDLL